jgi:uncharacterized protein (DUF1810 family)
MTAWMAEGLARLERFVIAQDPVYETVLSELRACHKMTHWMWYVFPQIAGLGQTSKSIFFSIASLDEARAYLADRILGPRLVECAGLVIACENRTAEDIFDHDAIKLRSSMTLFHRAAPDEAVFRQVLDRFYDGIPDPATDALLGGE